MEHRPVSQEPFSNVSPGRTWPVSPGFQYFAKADAEKSPTNGNRRPESDALGRHAGLRAGIHYRSSRVVPGLRPADIDATWSMDSGFRRNDGLWPQIEAQLINLSVCYRERLFPPLEIFLSDLYISTTISCRIWPCSNGSATACFGFS